MSVPHKRVKTPTVLQMEAVECGAASLAMILGYFRRFVPLEQLRIACGVSRDGSKASNILKAARTYGLTAKGYRYEAETLRGLKMPVILHWNMNHFVVLEGIRKDKVYLNDPGSGSRIVSWEELYDSFSGIVLTIEPGEEFRREDRRTTLFASLSARLHALKLPLAFVSLISFFLMIPGLVIPVFSRIFVDNVIIKGNTAWLMPLLAGLLLTALLRGLLTWMQQYYLLRLESKLALGMTGRFLWHTLRLPIEFYAQRQSGDLAKRITSNDSVAQLLSGELATSLLNLLMVVFYAIMMLQYSWPLTLVGVSLAVANLLLLARMSRARTDQNMKLQQEQGKLYGTFMDGMAQIESIKAGGRESDLFVRLTGFQAKALEAEQSLGALSRLFMSVPLLVMVIGDTLILGLGGLQIMNGSMTIGMLVAFQSLLQNFLTPLNGLLEMGNRLQEVKADLNRIDDVLTYPLPEQQSRPTESQPEEKPEKAKLSGQIELKEITFGYSRLDPPLISGFGLKVNPGDRVAIVGGSGSGKSTVAKLLTGLYTPWAGVVSFDGKPRGEWSPKVLQVSVGIVDQEIHMFEGTIRDNLTLWDPNVPETDMIRAAKDACIHDDIVTRPGGYDHWLEEGARNFSGGQKQRMEIARALINNPSILILDEATSALDPRTELQIDRNLRRRGCTCIIIAHRLSTIRDSDEIIVLDRGQVVQRGTHEELLERAGHYAELVRTI
ncbi:NHLP family bacteriocin export ABC transporter peptidase/permease/ATPase subunit [Paenibacillus sp. HJGM_3]|uniref:NHLP family bacteriocin export ABC transporter peptidase/permease/ATPase subunit n=1 Tax=Paenibacillus sp. HJGM_3 TaxID=3379816 RepID=UPI00385E9A38